MLIHILDVLNKKCGHILQTAPLSTKKLIAEELPPVPWCSQQTCIFERFTKTLLSSSDDRYFYRGVRDAKVNIKPDKKKTNTKKRPGGCESKKPGNDVNKQV